MSTGNPLVDGWTADKIEEHRRARAYPDMLTALESILEGSEVSGVWRDADGEQCEEDEPGARYEEYDQEEQATWLYSVAETARRAIIEAKGGRTPIADIDAKDLPGWTLDHCPASVQGAGCPDCVGGPECRAIMRRVQL